MWHRLQLWKLAQFKPSVHEPNLLIYIEFRKILRFELGLSFVKLFVHLIQVSVSVYEKFDRGTTNRYDNPD